MTVTFGSSVSGTSKAPKLTAESPFFQALSAWINYLTALNSSPQTLSAYRRDVIGVAGRLAPDAQIAALRLGDLTHEAVRSGFSSWAQDHAPPSVRRAHSAWTGFFDFLVAKDAVHGNPMGRVAKPPSEAALARAVNDPTLVSRLLIAAAVPDQRAHDPWPERDLALVAMYCLTGIRDLELVNLDVGSIEDAAEGRRLHVHGRGNKLRMVPVDGSLGEVLDRYLASCAERFPGRKVAQRDSPMFVDRRGRRLTAVQVKYLMTRLHARAGVSADVSTGALVNALRRSSTFERAGGLPETGDVPKAVVAPRSTRPDTAATRATAGHRHRRSNVAVGTTTGLG